MNQYLNYDNWITFIFIRRLIKLLLVVYRPPKVYLNVNTYGTWFALDPFKVNNQSLGNWNFTLN